MAGEQAKKASKARRDALRLWGSVAAIPLLLALLLHLYFQTALSSWGYIGAHPNPFIRGHLPRLLNV